MEQWNPFLVPDLANLILGNLEAEDVARFSQINRQSRAVSNASTVWNTLLHKDFGACLDLFTGHDDKSQYIKLWSLKHMLGAHNDICNITKYQYLELVGTTLSELPLLNRLQHLEINMPKLTTVYDFSAATPNLRKLSIGPNLLTVFPPLSLPHLTELNISHGKAKLTTLDLSNLPSLTKLTLADLSLTSLPHLSTLTQLQMLNLEKLPLAALPDLSGLTKLDKINLYYTNITVIDGSKLPSSLISLVFTGTVTKLENLQLLINLRELSVDNVETMYPRNILPEIKGLSQLVILSLTNIHLPSITNGDVHNWLRLNKLIIVNCKLSTIDDLVPLRNLRVLKINNNTLITIPTLQLPELRLLDISANSLHSMGSLVNLPLLHTLIVQNNTNLVIPDVSSLADLRMIDVGYLKTAPDYSHIPSTITIKWYQ